MTNLVKAKKVLERLDHLATYRQSSGINVLNELQELLDLAGPALDDILDAFSEFEDLNEQIESFEKELAGYENNAV